MNRSPLEYEYVRRLLQARLIARLGSLNPNGTIHLTAVWFLYEDCHLLIPTFSESRKIRNIRANRSVSVLVDRAQGGFDVQGVMLGGRASIVEGAEAQQLNRRVHRKYLKDAALESSLVRGAIRDDVTIMFKPGRVVSWDDTQRKIARLLRERDWTLPMD